MNETTSLVRTPTEQLAHILEPVPATMAARVSGTLAPFFAHLDEWEKERAMLHVTDESQVGKMKRAKVLRLEIRTARVAIEKACDSLKEDALREQRVVNAVLRLAQSLIEPLESSLKQDETFAERAEKGRQEQLASARVEVLRGLGVSSVALPPALGLVSDEAWQSIRLDAQRAKDARDQLVREAEEVRIESERIVAERRVKEEADRKQREAERLAEEARQREENERLRAEADAARVTAEALAVAAREEADAAHRTAEGERVAREKAESDLRAKEQSEDAERLEGLRLAQEAEQRRKLAGERGRFLEIATSIRSMAQTLDVIDEEAIQTKAGRSLGVKVRKRLMEVAADIEGAADRLATGEAS